MLKRFSHGNLPGLKSYMACTVIPDAALCKVTRGHYRTIGSLRSGPKKQKNKDVDLLWGLWWRRVQRRYDLHVRLLGFASGTSYLTLKRVEVNLLQQQEHLVFLLEKTKQKQRLWQSWIWQYPLTSGRQWVKSDEYLEWQPSCTAAIVVNGSNPMWKRKLVQSGKEKNRHYKKERLIRIRDVISAPSGTLWLCLTMYLL